MRDSLTHKDGDGVTEKPSLGEDLRQVAEDGDAGNEVATDVIYHVGELGQCG